jgi:hypothetical protein
MAKRPSTPSPDVEAELRETVATLAALAEPSVPPVSALLADLFAALKGTASDAGSSLQEAAARAELALQDASARATFFSLGVQLWQRLAGGGALTAARAEVLAPRLARCARFPALLFWLECDARTRGLDDAARLFATELDEAFPRFRAHRGRGTFEPELLDAVGAGALSLELQHGVLREASVDDGRSRTSLVITGPGEGRFASSGKRGGYGFIVDERYSGGAVHTTLYSPWHDGSESREEREWVCWVLECLGSLTQAARAATRGRTGPRRPRARR